LPIAEADKLTLNEIIIMNLGVQRQRAEAMKNTRLIMWEIRTKYLKKGKHIKPEDIFKMPGEKTVQKILTKEEYLKLKTLWPTPN